MWGNLSDPWRAALNELWLSMAQSRLPNGAAVADHDGNVVSRGRSRNFDTMRYNCNIAHAEMEALESLDIERASPRRLTLYSCVEPCMMCAGAAVLTGVRGIECGVRSLPHGATRCIGQIPGNEGRAPTVAFREGEIPFVVHALVAYVHVSLSPAAPALPQEPADGEHIPAVLATRELVREGVVKRLIAEDAPFSRIYDVISIRRHRT